MRRICPTIVLLIFCVCGTTSCLFRSHRVKEQRSLTPLKTATQAELVARINQASASIQTLNATVDIDTTVGGVKKGKVVEYQQIRGYILALKPRMLRMIGLLPILRNRAFDMASNGNRFELSIPPKNRFITGNAEITKPSGNALENLRPKVVYEALILPPVDEKTEIAVKEDGVQQVEDPKSHTMVPQPNYHLLVIQRGDDGEWHLERTIYFSRATLEPYRQTFYDGSGAVATDVVYSGEQDFGGFRFPSLIEIARPQEEYNITIKFLKLTVNTPLKPEQFELQPPAGAAVTELK